MLIFPLGHESQRVRRLPWVTFIVMGLNVLLFLYASYVGGAVEDRTAEKYNEFREFLYAHPYLKVPPVMEQQSTPEEDEKLQEIRDNASKPDLEQAAIDSEQRQLDGIADEFTRIADEDHPLKKWGYIPEDPHFINAISYMFLHSGWFQLISNMLFLYLAGCSIEDLWGRPVYIAFYLLSGILTAWIHAFGFPESAQPLLGASGAIAGLMGAFALRLYDTKFTFFYFFTRPGTFKAPAYVMLPLWLMLQLVDSFLADSSEMGFFGLLGGFFFGVSVALLIRVTRFEEKFIAPAIEKKLSLAQNPLYLQAIEKSEAGDYPGAVSLLEKVVRQEPNHLDALMEMRRISEMTRDETGYARHSAGLLEALVRVKESNLLNTTYRQYLDHPDHKPLPPKTIFSIASYFDDEHEPETSLQLYQLLTAVHPDDALSMKALSRVARIYFDKLNDPEKGKAALIQAYEHPHASDEWRSALQTDFRRYGIQAPAVAPASPVRPAHAEPAAKPVPVPISPAPVAAPPAPVLKPPAPVPVKPAPSPAPRAPEPAGSAIDTGTLPNPAFDGDTSENITLVSCQVEKMVLTGLMLSNEEHAVGILPYRKISYMSTGRVRNTGSTEASSGGEMFILDLVTVVVERSKKFIVYRLQGRRIPFNKIFPLVEQTSQDAFQNFAGILESNSGAVCLPDRDSCLGPGFMVYQNWNQYETQLRDRLMQDA